MQHNRRFETSESKKHVHTQIESTKWLAGKQMKQTRKSWDSLRFPPMIPKND